MEAFLFRFKICGMRALAERCLFYGTDDYPHEKKPHTIKVQKTVQSQYGLKCPNVNFFTLAL
jgi:hypothetical protein